MKAVITCKGDWDDLDKGAVEEIVVENTCCNEEGFDVLDLSECVNLRELRVGNECFTYVNEVKLIGLRELETIAIGKHSFKNYGYDPNRHFYLKDCPKLKSLKMGHSSFSGYTVCEIENVDALETIEIGSSIRDVFDILSINFQYASLELKSILIHKE